MEATLCVVLGKKFVDEVLKMFDGGCSFFLKKKKKGKRNKKATHGLIFLKYYLKVIFIKHNQFLFYNCYNLYTNSILLHQLNV